MTKEFYNLCEQDNKQWSLVNADIERITDPELLKQLYKERIKHLEWRIEQYEKNIQS